MRLWLLTGNSEQISAEEHKEIKCRKSSIMFCAVRLFLKQSIAAHLSSRWEWACSELRFVGTVFCCFVTKAAGCCTIWPIAFKGKYCDYFHAKLIADCGHRAAVQRWYLEVTACWGLCSGCPRATRALVDKNVTRSGACVFKMQYVNNQDGLQWWDVMVLAKLPLGPRILDPHVVCL